MDPVVNFNDLPATQVVITDLPAAISSLAHGADADLRHGKLALSGTGTTVVPAALLAIVQSGSIKATSRDGSIDAAAGDVVAIGNGCTIYWDIDDATLLVICHLGTAIDPSLRKLDLAHALAPSQSPAANVLRGPSPDCSRISFCDDAAFSYGIWSATPYDRIPVPMAKTELMHVLDGAVTISTDTGLSQRFEAGDTFISPQGAKLGWTSDVPVRKLWMLSQAS